MDLIRNPDEAISLFAVDAAIEIPYLVEVGLPGQFKGQEQILNFLRQINTLFPDVALLECALLLWNHRIKWLANTRSIAQLHRLKGSITSCFSEGL